LKSSNNFSPEKGKEKKRVQNSKLQPLMRKTLIRSLSFSRKVLIPVDINVDLHKHGQYIITSLKIPEIQFSNFSSRKRVRA
jgi:hypothetical protein